MTKLHRYLRANDALLVATDVRSCLEAIASTGRIGSPFYYYRGVPSAKYHLETSLDRALSGKTWDRARRELRFLEEFQRVAHNHLPSPSLPTTVFGWLSLMQHYRVPTRLLDLTRSPYIALYFAVREWNTNTDAAVFAFNPTGLHEATLHRLRAKEFPHSLPKYPEFLLPELAHDAYFTTAFLKGNYSIAAILEPTWVDRRQASQQAAFLTSDATSGTLEDTLADLVVSRDHLDEHKRAFLEKNAKDWSVVKLVIPSNLKKKLFLELAAMNVHAATLFPDLEGAALRIRENGIAEEWVLAKYGPT